MNRKKLKSQAWYNYAVAACIGVVLYVALTHLKQLEGATLTFTGYFKPVIMGCVIAYIVSPLANLYKNKLFKEIDNVKARRTVSNALAFVTVFAFLIALMIVLIPQLVSSITMFANNLDDYVATLASLLKELGVSSQAVGLQGLLESSDDILGKVSSYVSENIDKVLSVSADLGKGAFNWLIAMFLAVYFLAEKESLKSGLKDLLDSTMSRKRYDSTVVFLRHCNDILNRYIVFNLLDAVIIAIVNMVFMTIMGFPYAGLVSFTVGLTNLVPTFGPFVGAASGAFILLLVNPIYAGIFLIFTLILQIFDGYILKPKLFGNSLGVSALWVLIAIIVGGNMFGVIGILVSIPTIAILDDVYHEYFIPWLKRRKEMRAAEEDAQQQDTAK